MGAALGSIIGIVAAVFAPYAAAALGLTGLGATLFGIGLQLAVGSIFSKKKSGGGGSVADSGLLVNKTSNVASIPVIYGDSSDTNPGRRLGGTRVYMQSTTNGGATSGTGSNEYLHVVLVYAHGGGTASTSTHHSTGPVAHRILLNDKVAWTAAGGVQGDFVGKFDVALFNGCTDQDHSVGKDYDTFSGGLSSKKSDEWTTAHKLQGVAYAYCRFQFDRDVFPGAPTILIESTGIKVKDVYEVQQGTTSTALYANKSNPANIIYDYLTNITFGKGLDPDDIDIDSFVAAKNYYDTINLDFIGAVQTNETIFNNVQQLLASCNANLYYSRGKYAISIHKQETFDGSTFIFNTDNILGEWTISLGSKANRFNNLTVNYYDADNNWQPNSIKVENATYLSADSDVINEGGIDLSMIRIKADADRLGKFYLDQSRSTIVVNFKASHEALQLDVNDICYIDHEVPGWNGDDKKKFRVQALVLNSDSTVEVTLMEYAPDTIYIENQ